ncbi:MAG: hypothetical protein AAFY31_03355 [Pseudomonadota bacterium]
MADPAHRLFLARDSYKRRRFSDAARLLPLLGFVLLVLPGLFTTTTGSLIYIFTVWGLLIIVIGLVSHWLVRTETASTSDENDPSQDGP